MDAVSRLLPRSRSRMLVGVVAAVALLYALLALAVLISLRTPASAALAIAFATFSWGMWRLKKWARWLTVAVLWFCVIVVPVGLLNPFAAMEWKGGAPQWEVLAFWVALGVVLGLFLLHVLGRHKAEFKW